MVETPGPKTSVHPLRWGALPRERVALALVMRNVMVNFSPSTAVDGARRVNDWARPSRAVNNTAITAMVIFSLDIWIS